MKHFYCGAGLFLLALGWILPQQLQAAAVTVVPGAGVTQFAYTDSSIIADSSSYGIRIGYFTSINTPDFTAGLSEGTAQVFANIDAAFIPLGEGGASLGGNFTWTISALTGAGAGKFSIAESLNSASLVFTGSAPANTASAAGLPRGSRLFLLAYNGTDYAAATQLGIFSAAEWTVSTDPAVSFITMNLGDVDNVPSEVFRGSLGTGFLQLATVIPEPAAGIFTFSAGMTLLLRRRRRAC